MFFFVWVDEKKWYHRIIWEFYDFCFSWEISICFYCRAPFSVQKLTISSLFIWAISKAEIIYDFYLHFVNYEWEWELFSYACQPFVCLLWEKCLFVSTYDLWMRYCFLLWWVYECFRDLGYQCICTQNIMCKYFLPFSRILCLIFTRTWVYFSVPEA